MKTFTVFENKQELELIAIKNGFCWPVLFFGIFWMAAHKLWDKFIIWAAFMVLVYFAQEPIHNMIDSWQPGDGFIIFLTLAILNILSFFMTLYPGFKGNYWREKKLREMGYRPTKKIEANSPEEAILKTMAKMKPAY